MSYPETPIAAATSILPSEARHPDSIDLDQLTSAEVLALLNREDAVAVAAVGRIIPQLAGLVDDGVDCIRHGGRVHYFGAGTSGRLGVLDAAELLPTFRVEPGVFNAHVAGGSAAIMHAVEGAEDSSDDGRRAAQSAVHENDIVIGITVSGTTPYVRGALEGARENGARTAIFTSNPESPLAVLADHILVAETGPEVLTGSTRLKGGTATKLMLNGFSTAVLVGLGRTYSNLMVSVVATNEKLRARTLRILSEVTGETDELSARRLDDAGDDLAVAVVAAVTGADETLAREALGKTGGAVGAAIRSFPARAQ